MAELCPPLQARGASVAAVPAPLQPARSPSFILDQVADSNGCGPHKIPSGPSEGVPIRRPRGATTKRPVRAIATGNPMQSVSIRSSADCITNTPSRLPVR